MADHWGHLPMLMFYTNKLSDTTPQFPQRRVFTKKTNVHETILLTFFLAANVL